MEIFVDEIIKSIEKSEGNMMTKVIVIYVYKRKYLQSTHIIIPTFFCFNFWEE